MDGAPYEPRWSFTSDPDMLAAAGLEDEYDGLAEMYGFPAIPAVRKCDCGRLVEFKSHCPKCDEPCPVFHRKGAGCPVCNGSGYVMKAGPK